MFPKFSSDFLSTRIFIRHLLSCINHYFSFLFQYTIGVRAWKQWLISKNEQTEQAALAANKKAKTFNTNILRLTTDELNYLLCLFVKEVRKPNGMEYAPDTIYYLCLSIQQYLFENGRIDNIFSDSLYEPFTNALDDVAKKFSEVNDATRTYYLIIWKNFEVRNKSEVTFRRFYKIRKFQWTCEKNLRHFGNHFVQIFRLYFGTYFVIILEKPESIKEKFHAISNIALGKLWRYCTTTTDNFWEIMEEVRGNNKNILAAILRKNWRNFCARTR